jgi:hypothetical protein
MTESEKQVYNDALGSVSSLADSQKKRNEIALKRL